jgi:K+-sensing histidine kinase KdpD
MTDMLTNKTYISLPVNPNALKKTNRQLSILLEISDFLSTERDLLELLHGVLSKILNIFDMDAGRIYMMDKDEAFLYLAAHQGIDAEGLEKINMDDGFTGKSARTRSFIAQHVLDLQDKKRAGLLQSKGLRHVICVPLITMDRVTGVMNLATGGMLRLDQEKIDLLTAIGNQIAVAVNNVLLHQELKNQIQIIRDEKEMVKFFAYSVSHDLKSPSVGLYALTKRLQEKHAQQMNEKGQEVCDQIMKTAGQMVDLVEKINAFIQTREAKLQLEKFCMKEVIETIRNENAPVLKRRKISWRNPQFFPVIVADKSDFYRVFRNLVENALKYGGKDMRELRLDYRDEGDFHTFSMSDDGVGLRERDKESVFDLFRRHETSRGQSGSGLGLAIVKEIAEKHKGRAWVERGSDRGVTFSFSIYKNLETSG